MESTPGPPLFETVGRRAERQARTCLVEGIRRVPPDQWRGELGYLAAISPTVHRLTLELSDRHAAAIATAINETGAVTPETAQLQGIALAGVFQIIISEAGRRTTFRCNDDRSQNLLRSSGTPPGHTWGSATRMNAN